MIWNSQSSEGKAMLWFVTKVQCYDISTSRKASSLMQPGWGIRKIINLYHDLPNLVEKAGKHMLNIMQSKIEEMDRIEFAGLSDDVIEKECKEYVCWCLRLILGVTHHVIPAIGIATQLSNSLICWSLTLRTRLTRLTISTTSVHRYVCPVIWHHLTNLIWNSVAGRCQWHT